MSIYQFNRTQLLHASVDEVWDFISSPANLAKITPEYMGFKITSGELTKKMYAGMIISYKVKPLAGIKMAWVTEITHLVEKKYFVDEQRSGPYSIWHHQHILEPSEHGVLMRDIISYKPLFGFLGRFANILFIHNQLNRIFNYRTQALDKRFNQSL